MNYTVIIPMYNAGKTIRRCVESTLQQTIPPAEILLIDDGSEDETIRITEELKENNLSIRILQQEHAGVSAARNRGLKEAKGEWVLFLDADDCLAPGAIEKYQFIIHHSEFIINGETKIDACCGGIVRGRMQQQKDLSARPHSVGDLLPKSEDLDRSASALVEMTNRSLGMTGKESIEYALAEPTDRLTIHGWIFRREVCKEELFNEKLRMAEDSEWVLRVLKHCRSVSFIPEPVYLYTVSEESTVHGWKPGQTEAYLETLKEIEQTDVRQAENWPVFVLTHLLLILTHDVFHPANPADETQKRKTAKALTKSPLFAEAFQTANLGQMEPKKRIVLECLKHGWILPAEAAIRIRQKQNSRLAAERTENGGN